MFKQFKALREVYNPYSPYMPYEDRYDIKQQPDINDGIKAVPDDEANLEAERGEVVLKPDLSGVYRVGGNRHYDGGTPLNLPKGSFIFSDDKDLHITPEEKQVFKFKKGGFAGKRLNTPARVVKREVDLKHYNSSNNILQDHAQDSISKNSAQLMLQGYQKKLGQVAFVQEAKKGFPTGVPNFSANTAPAINPQTQEQLTQNKQYMQVGGVTNPGYFNPYTPNTMRYQAGGPFYDPSQFPLLPSDAYPGGATGPGRITPKGLSNSFDYFGGVPKLVRDWQTKRVDMTNLNTRDSQSAMYNWSMNNDPTLIQNMWRTYGNTNQGKRQGLNFNYNNLTPDQLGKASGSYIDGMLEARTFGPNMLPSVVDQRTPPQVSPGSPTAPPVTANGPGPDPTQPFGPNAYNPGNTLPYRPNIAISPLQKANLLYSAYQAMSVPRYQPARSQIKSPLVELNKYNPQAALSAVQNSATQAYTANRAENPYLSGTNNATIYGKSLEAQQQVIGDYANRNVGVGNQQAEQNNQIQRQDMMFNTEANQKYYDQTQQLAQNYNNEKRTATNQGVSLFNNYMSQNQALEQMLASQRTYGRTQIGTDRNGQPVYQAKPLYDVDTHGMSPYVYYTGAGSLNGIPQMGNRLQDLQSVGAALKNMGVDLNSPAAARWFAALRGQPALMPYSYNQAGANYGPGGEGYGAYKSGGMYGWMKSMYNNPYAHRG